MTHLLLQLQDNLPHNNTNKKSYDVRVHASSSLENRTMS